jgi:hypothetical protein
LITTSSAADLSKTFPQFSFLLRSAGAVVGSAPIMSETLARLLALPLFADWAKHRRWLRWTLRENAGGRRTKVPDCSTRLGGSWRELADVLADGPIYTGSGIGLVMTDGLRKPEQSPVLCVDLDACRDPKTGAVSEWADEILNVSGRSYCEVSPSGYGLHLWVRAADGLFKLGQRTRVLLKAPPPSGCEKLPEIQVFGTGPAGYVTMTGDHYAGSGLQVRDV